MNGMTLGGAGVKSGTAAGRAEAREKCGAFGGDIDGDGERRKLEQRKSWKRCRVDKGIVAELGVLGN